MKEKNGGKWAEGEAGEGRRRKQNLQQGGRGESRKYTGKLVEHFNVFSVSGQKSVGWQLVRKKKMSGNRITELFAELFFWPQVLSLATGVFLLALWL